MEHSWPHGALHSLPAQGLTRRVAIQALAATVGSAALASRPEAAEARGGDPAPLSPFVLPPGVRSRFVSNVNGLRMHVLEAGFETLGRPAVLLMHGFPELA